MAGDWIIMRMDLPDDPSVVSMAAALNVDEDMIVGKLHRLWSWADKHSKGGRVDGVTPMWIDRYVRVDGFSNAMRAAGWLETDDSGVTFPRFERHNGKSAKVRVDSALRQRESRARKSSDAPMSQKCHNDVTKPCDKSVTTEEKRTEEKTKDKAAAPPFPPVLDREDFRKAWDDYLAYRREAKLKRLQPRSISAQFAEMVAWGPDLAIQAIRTTIAKGWTGIFEPKGEFGRPIKPPPKPGPEKLSDAGQSEFKAWWRERSPEQRGEFARSVGVDVNTVDQNVNWRRVPATWARTGEAS